jgi:cbb3-type cytochrome oxidase maturation protein|tara:strand:+ start:240 stop:518 length:279 start_codon:yes stop_codon:yes gene_type:complete
MGVIYILIPVAIILSAIGIYLFFWAVKTEQFEDLEKQGMSILFDDIDNSETKNTQDKEDDTLKNEQSLHQVNNKNSVQQVKHNSQADPTNSK